MVSSIEDGPGTLSCCWVETEPLVLFGCPFSTGFSAIECYKAKNQRGLTSSNSMHRQVCTKRPSMGVIRKESPPCTGQRSYMIEEGSPIDEEGMSASQCLLAPGLICAMPSRRTSRLKRYQNPSAEGTCVYRPKPRVWHLSGNLI